MKYTSIDRILAKFGRDVDFAGVGEADIIEWTGEALEAIKAVNINEEAIAFLEVTNYTLQLPAHLHSIIQIAKNTVADTFTSSTDNTDDSTTTEIGTDVPVCLDCNGAPINDYSVAYYRPYYDLRYEYDLWRDHPVYQRSYIPVKLTTHSFFGGLVCEANSDEKVYNIDSEYAPEYKPINQNTALQFNFETGLVALAYRRNMLDDNGLPMVPDEISFTEAIIRYITYKLVEKHYLNGREGFERKIDRAERKWKQYCLQAGNYAMMIKGEDEYENLLKQRSYLLPRKNVYSNYFGNLGKEEIKNILNTNHRNNARRGIEDNSATII